MFPWRRLINLCFILLIFFSFIFLISSRVRADEIDDLQKQIDVLNKAREQSEAATKPLEGQLGSLKLQLAQIQSRLATLSAQIQQKQKDLDVREQRLAELTNTFNQRVQNDYKDSFFIDPLGVILGEPGKFSDKLYHLITIDQNRSVIKQISSELLSIIADKDKLESDKAKLASLQSQVDQNASFLGGEINKAKAYQADLSSQIAQLSSRQQALIAAKLASLNIPRSAYAGVGGGCIDDRGIDPGFSPRFAIFTYGVPNRIGLNQWGAKGRAEAGQGAQSILEAYYNADYTSGYNQSINIHVVGTNEYGESFDDNYNIDDYLKHLYEMPTNWPPEALKAQAIAARSYALASTNNGSSTICPSQSCQVVKKEINDGNWQAAVEATKGIVLTSGGSPIKAWFSSTHGGYVLSSSEIGWSSTPYTKHNTDSSSGVGSFSDLQSSAYDRNSPWFYCDWGSRAVYNKTAWLKGDELADIANVILLAQKNSSDVPHLSQTDSNVPDTWSVDQVKSELRNNGGTPFSSVSSISINWDSSAGRTTGVNISGDAGNINVDGASFKQYFNLRAPANIQIVGPLFNVEQR